MITTKDNFFHIQTADSSYIFSHTDSGLLIHNYYGPKVKFYNYENITGKLDGGFGTSILYEGNVNEHIDNIDLEFSSVGIGDFRESIITLFNPNYGHSSNFKYQGFEILSSNEYAIPHSYGETEVIRIDLYDLVLDVKVELYYKVFEESNVISRYIRLINNSNNDYILTRLFSLQIDFKDSDYVMMTFEGAWAKERHLKEKELESGIYINDSKSGASSNKHNPLVILRKINTDENCGLCYGFNLVYSGNHKTTVEVTPHLKTRVLMGINDHAFNYTISPKSIFVTPEAVISCSNKGVNKLSQNFHSFVNNHIIRGEYKNKQRPILINSWEASYFNFNEKKLLELARSAKNVGIELFVLDDGWFGKRNNDKKSLGDWDVNLKKLPGGLGGFSAKINKMGLDFGLWVEPEMINEDSNLYKEHPEWAVKIKGRKPGISRNQMLLDLTNKEVRDFLTDKLSEVFSSCNLKYVKWDYNRNISDMFGLTLKNQGEFFHRYILGFYEVMSYLTNKFPNILFEGCASGGNRFDLGILCYFPQIWTSDDTDYLERIYIQTGTSYGYPQSSICNHVSDIPNHQTLRNTPLLSRFNISCFGNLGYELDLTNLSNDELSDLKEHIKFYKQHRMLFQYGTFYRSEKSIFSNNSTYLYLINKNQNQGIIGFFQSLVHPALSEDILYVNGLKDDDLYSFYNIKQNINIKKFGGLINIVSPIKIKLNGKIHNIVSKVYKIKSEKEKYYIYGDCIRYSGIRLHQQFMGTGFNNKVRVLGDFGTRMYIVKKYIEKNISKT